MTLERNAGDLAEHEKDFALRRGFTYSVVSDTGDEVIGCVYIYPSAKDGVEADVRSWVRATRADLDTPCVPDGGRMAAHGLAVQQLRLRPSSLSAKHAPARGTVPQPGASGDDSTDTS